jgi:cytoskeletal protein CcmA (bactofilin family)
MASDDTCLIGEKITVRGQLSGKQPLVVEGRLEGRVALESHLTVEPAGIVEADVEATQATVRGEVRGTLQATRVATLEASCRVTGRVSAPQIIIEEGARFSGEIDMEVPLPEDVRPGGA